MSLHPPLLGPGGRCRVRRAGRRNPDGGRAAQQRAGEEEAQMALSHLWEMNDHRTGLRQLPKPLMPPRLFLLLPWVTLHRTPPPRLGHKDSKSLLSILSNCT